MNHRCDYRRDRLDCRRGFHGFGCGELRSRGFCSIVSRGNVAPRDAFDFHARRSRSVVAELDSGGITHVDYATAEEGPSVIDTNNHAFPVFQVRHAGVARKLHGRVGGRHGKHVIALADSGFASVKLFSVPTGDARLRKGAVPGHRVVTFSHDGVRTICGFIGLLDFESRMFLSGKGMGRVGRTVFVVKLSRFR